MPNHTSCVLIVKSTKSEFEKIRELMTSETMEDGEKTINLFDFDKIIPMPKELGMVKSPVTIVSQKEYDKAVKELEVKKSNNFLSVLGNLTLPLTKEMQEDYLARFGSDNWYDWARKNWGTKWNAHDCGEWKKQALSFQTAWSPPMPVIEVLSKMFPKATFILQYADEGCGFCGTATFKDGECDDNCMTDSESPEFRELYTELRGEGMFK